MNRIKIKIHNVPGYSGTIIVETNENGVPLDRFWRKRIADAKIDNCVEVVKPSGTKKQEKVK